eukprot:5194493-Pleurochrysis_carterae.AAC.1
MRRRLPPTAIERSASSQPLITRPEVKERARRVGATGTCAPTLRAQPRFALACVTRKSQVQLEASQDFGACVWRRSASELRMCDLSHRRVEMKWLVATRAYRACSGCEERSQNLTGTLEHMCAMRSHKVRTERQHGGYKGSVPRVFVSAQGGSADTSTDGDEEETKVDECG